MQYGSCTVFWECSIGKYKTFCTMFTIYKQYCYLIIVHIDKERKGKYERSKRRSN
nr:MAG TPA: hypothetical protein [Bacteriophage sp.]